MLLVQIVIIRLHVKASTTIPDGVKINDLQQIAASTRNYGLAINFEYGLMLTENEITHEI